MCVRTTDIFMFNNIKKKKKKKKKMCLMTIPEKIQLKGYLV